MLGQERERHATREPEDRLPRALLPRDDQRKQTGERIHGDEGMQMPAEQLMCFVAWFEMTTEALADPASVASTRTDGARRFTWVSYCGGLAIR